MREMWALVRNNQVIQTGLPSQWVLKNGGQNGALFLMENDALGLSTLKSEDFYPMENDIPTYNSETHYAEHDTYEIVVETGEIIKVIDHYKAVKIPTPPHIYPTLQSQFVKEITLDVVTPKIDILIPEGCKVIKLTTKIQSDGATSNLAVYFNGDDENLSYQQNEIVAQNLSITSKNVETDFIKLDNTLIDCTIGNGMATGDIIIYNEGDFKNFSCKFITAEDYNIQQKNVDGKWNNSNSINKVTFLSKANNFNIGSRLILWAETFGLTNTFTPVWLFDEEKLSNYYYTTNNDGYVKIYESGEIVIVQEWQTDGNNQRYYTRVSEEDGTYRVYENGFEILATPTEGWRTINQNEPQVAVDLNEVLMILKNNVSVQTLKILTKEQSLLLDALIADYKTHFPDAPF